MKILKLLWFEWSLRSRQLPFYMLLLLFVILSVVSFIDLDDGFINGNAPYRIGFFITSLSLMSVFPAMIFSNLTLLRDIQHNFEELIFSTSIDKIRYYFSRFLSVFSTVLIISSLPIVGFYIAGSANVFVSVGENNLINYLWLWLIMMLPNTFFVTVITFAITLFYKKSIMTYVSGILIFVVFWLGSFYINSPLTGGQVLASSELLHLASLLDYFGFAAFFEQTQFWTPFQKNEISISLTESLMINRLIWLIFSILILLISFTKFDFRKKQISSFKGSSEEPINKIMPYNPVSVDSDGINNWLKVRRQMFWACLKIDAINVIFTRGFVILMLAWVILIGLGMHFLISGDQEFGGRYPEPGLLIGIIDESFSALGAFLIIFYSGVLMWNDRNSRFHELMSSTPLPRFIYLVSKLAVLAIIIFVALSIAIISGIFFQVSSAYYPISIVEFMSVYYFQGFPVLLIAFFAVLVQTVVPNKYLAMIFTAFIVLLFGPMAESFGLADHQMVRFLHMKSMAKSYSAMFGYGQYAEIFNAFAIYWIPIAGICALLSVKWHNRSYSFNWKSVLKVIVKPWAGFEKMLLFGFSMLFLATGSYVYYHTYSLAPDAVSADDYWFNEQYERRFKQYEKLPIMQIVDVKTEVAIYPYSKRFIIEADYTIENTTAENISEMLISVPMTTQSLKLSRGTLKQKDSLLKSYLFSFKEPIIPGEQLQMTFQIDKKQVGFATTSDVLENGTYLAHNQFDPFLGYVDFLEIDDADEREKRGLPEKPLQAFIDPHLPAEGKFSFNKVDYETTISTSGDQIALASGKLIRKWSENGRNFFHYKTNQKIRRVMNYFSARYLQKTLKYRETEIEMYFHPMHYRNIDMMMNYTKTTLAYANDNFGPYQHDYLRIAEVSGHRGFGGQAMPGVIAMTEGAMYTKDIRKPEKGINVVARRTIHEVAHQWWSHQLSPKRVVGGSVLTESLCKYTEAVVLEDLYGSGMVRRLSDYTCRRYFTGRAYARTPEPPLFLIDRQQYIAYSKGYLVLNALKRLLGEEQMNQSLRALLAKHREMPTATSNDLIEELYQVAPIKYHQLIDDWMKKVILYDLKILSATYEKIKENKYEITIELKTKRTEVQASGEENIISIDEPLEIGLFSKHPDQLKKGEKPMYLKSYQISDEHTTIQVITDDLPQYIAIDPHLTRPDKNRSDNLLKI